MAEELEEVAACPPAICAPSSPSHGRDWLLGLSLLLLVFSLVSPCLVPLRLALNSLNAEETHGWNKKGEVTFRVLPCDLGSFPSSLEFRMRMAVTHEGFLCEIFMEQSMN